MKKELLLVMTGVLLTTSVRAAETKIGFINDAALAQQSTALQGLQLQRDKMIASLKAEIEKEAQAIINRKKELAEQEKDLSKAELGIKLDSIDKAERELQEKAQKAGSKLQEEFANALISFKENAITPVVNELAKEKGFSAIVDARTAFYMDDKLDVTKQAIERVNKKMPKIDIKKVSLEPAKKAKK